MLTCAYLVWAWFQLSNCVVGFSALTLFLALLCVEIAYMLLEYCHLTLGCLLDFLLDDLP